MAFKIVRNDITKMNTEAIVNTANEQPRVDTGCDHAVYMAAGYDDLLNYRKDKIGSVPEGEVFITPGFKLAAKYIIHAVSPRFIDGESGEEEKLRSCYRKSLLLAKETGIRSIAFPLISTGGFGYPKEEGMRIAVDEINAFLSENDMDIRLVVFDDSAKTIGAKLYPGLEEYIDRKYVERAQREEYDLGSASADSASDRRCKRDFASDGKRRRDFAGSGMGVFSQPMVNAKPGAGSSSFSSLRKKSAPQAEESVLLDFETEHARKLAERMRHR